MTISNNVVGKLSLFTQFIGLSVTVAIIFIGIVNYSAVQSIVYLSGALLVAVIMFGIFKLPGMTHILPQGTETMCLELANYNFLNPRINMALLAFTLIYTCAIMLFDSSTMNPTVFGTLATLTLLVLGVDISTAYYSKCRAYWHILVGLIVGSLFGLMWFSLFYAKEPGLLLFASRPSNNVTCKKASDRKFKCSVYKNGQLIHKG
jgi:hypothetical protein